VEIVTEDYFRVLRIPLLRGRWFDPGQDRAEHALRSLVINEVMAQTLWPGQDPIGKHITLSWNGRFDRFGTVHAEVIGVTPNIRSLWLSVPNRVSTLYFYLPQVPNLFMSFVVRTRDDPRSLTNAVRHQIAGVDPAQPVANVRTMEDVVAAEVQQPRFTTALLSGFAALALLLAAIGIYGVISYSVAQRTSEVGVRIALGAQPSDIVRLVVQEGFRLVLVGVAAGLAMALVVTRLMGTLLFNVRPGDPLTLFLGCAVLLTAALIANFLPAHRAARLDPLVALRYE
jgi:putative ABC transport system permease protein